MIIADDLEFVSCSFWVAMFICMSIVYIDIFFNFSFTELYAQI